MLEDVVTAKQKNKAKLNKHYADDAGLKLFSFLLSLSLFLALSAECCCWCRGVAAAAADCNHVPSPGNKHQQHQSLVFILQPRHVSSRRVATATMSASCHGRATTRDFLLLSFSHSLFLVLFNCRSDSIQDWGKERKKE